MSFDEIYKTVGDSGVDFSHPTPVTCLEIWVFEDNTSHIRYLNEDENGKLAGCTFSEWLTKTGPYACPQDRRIRGALRLVIQRVSRPWFSAGLHIPLREEDYKSMLETFDLSRDFAFTQCAVDYLSPYIRRPSLLGDFTIAFHSPACLIKYATATLKYDATNGTTSGYLGITDTEQTCQFLDMLERSASHACHPLLIPTVLNRVWLRTYCDTTHIQNCDSNHVKNMLTYELDSTFKPFDQKNHSSTFAEAHKMIIHTEYNLGLTFEAFVRQYNTGLESCFESLAKLQVPSLLQNDVSMSELQLKDWCQLAQQSLVTYEQERSRVNRMKDLHLQVLYNLEARKDRQHQIQEAATMRELTAATKADSAAMKAIALLTMTFLPATAIASIFSMSPFFSSESNRLAVTADFWIYWVITIPLTLLVLSVWWIWHHLFHNHKRRLALTERLEGLKSWP